MTHRALDFAFRLWRVRLADARCNRNGDHEIGKAGIPTGFVLHHFQQHAFHAMGERHGCLRPPTYSKASSKQRMRVGVSQRFTNLTKRMREYPRIATKP